MSRVRQHRMCIFAPQSGQARPPVDVDEDSTDHVVRARANRNRVRVEVHAKDTTNAADPGEQGVRIAIDVGQVEIDVRP